MIIVDASVLYEVLVNGPAAAWARSQLRADEQAAPHLIDAEVLGVLRRDLSRNRFDRTIAELAVEDLQSWPGQRIGHLGLLQRVWELRANVRPADAFYVTLAEVFDAPLVTLDKRLVDATGPQCEFICPPQSP